MYGIMSYNRESIGFHLYATYYLRYVAQTPIACTLEETKAMEIDEVFCRSTDGAGCPLARCWSPDDFIRMCRETGFSKIEYQGGYPNLLESKLAKNILQKR